MEKCIASAYTLPAAKERGRTMGLLTSDDEHEGGRRRRGESCQSLLENSSPFVLMIRTEMGRRIGVAAESIMLRQNRFFMKSPRSHFNFLIVSSWEHLCKSTKL